MCRGSSLLAIHHRQIDFVSFRSIFLVALCHRRLCMKSRLASVSLCSFGSIFLLGGCHKPADQQQSSATDANSSAPASESAKSTPKAEAPRPRPVVVPADTFITVVLDEAVGSKISTPGQNFAATVSQPVEVDGRTAIPKGARATGLVKDAKPAGGGALIGGLAGGGKGAIIGGLIGAAAGTGGAGLTGNRDIKLPAETPLTFKLVDPLEIHHKR